MNNYKLTIGWLYPDLMSTYGDRGNIICLQKRCVWRKIKVTIQVIDVNSSNYDIEGCDLIIGGGAQDRQQEIVINDLLKRKSVFKRLFDREIPGLFVCGSPQLLGHYYMTGDGKKLPGLGIFDFITKHFGHDKPRCIGNTAGELLNYPIISRRSGIHDAVIPIQSGTASGQLSNYPINTNRRTIVGFENHGGRTYLGKNCQPFARVKRGYGNNGEDGYEGAVYKNVIACYYHGPILPKNPHVADWLIAKSLEIKYKRKIQLESLDDALEWQAHEFILKRMGLEVTLCPKIK